MCSDLAGRRGGGEELIIIQSRRFEHLTRLKVMGNKIRPWRKRGRKKEHACLPRAPRFFLKPI